MKKYFLILTLIVLLNFAYGQSKSSNYDISDRWTFVIYRDTIQLEMILYYKARFIWGTIVDHSMAICKNKKGDTLRVIELCPGPKDYLAGQFFTFTTYKHITKDEKTYKKYLPGDKFAIEKFKYNYIKPTSFGVL